MRRTSRRSPPVSAGTFTTSSTTTSAGGCSSSSQPALAFRERDPPTPHWRSQHGQATSTETPNSTAETTTSTTETSTTAPLATTSRAAAAAARADLDALRAELATADETLTKARDATAAARADAARARAGGVEAFRTAVAKAVACETQEKEAALASIIVGEAVTIGAEQLASLEQVALGHELRERHPMAFSDTFAEALDSRIVPRVEAAYRELRAIQADLATMIDASAAGVAAVTALETSTAKPGTSRAELPAVLSTIRARLRGLRTNDPDLHVSRNAGLQLLDGSRVAVGDPLDSGAHRLVIDGHVVQGHPDFVRDQSAKVGRIAALEPSSDTAADARPGLLLTID